MNAKLDLGCGANPTGDVNVDLYPVDIGHRTGVKGITGFKIPTCNFILWDLNRYPLPFATNSFNEVYSSNTIEHLNNPYSFLKECIRISNNKITIICPNGLGERLTKIRKNPYHQSFLTRKWFKAATDKIGNIQIMSKITDYTGFPTKYGPLRVPYEIKVEMVKL